MKYPLLLFLLCFFEMVFSQAGEKISKVEILLENQSIKDLAMLGIEVDHGQHFPGRYLIHFYSESEIEKIKAAGFRLKYIQEDCLASFNKNSIEQRAVPCTRFNPVKNYSAPANFKLGTMGGYLTYNEMLENLDRMASMYPELVSQRQEIDTFRTYEGNPLYWLKISDNVGADENEPEVLYTALHHAREPGSLSQLIFFMWYLLENYSTDENVRFLLDNTELYFIPCLNPDGYRYNEFTNPEGGGFWRKNRKLNADGTMGVDLNRNYGYEWGFDDFGSSPNGDSETYRGEAPFSEPETRAVKYFCEQREFKVALNYHTHGNLLIFPWGYSDTPSPDSATFRNLAAVMTLQNNYFAGTGSETVGYTVNGNSDDWMYGEVQTKSPIFAMTPEVGNSFWPDSITIVPTCQATLWQNLVSTNTVHAFGIVEDQSGTLTDELNNVLPFTLLRSGFTDGTLTVSLASGSPEVIQTSGSKSFNPAFNEVMTDSLTYALDPNLSPGSEFRLILSLQTPDVRWNDTISKTYMGAAPILFSDNASEPGNWIANDSTSWMMDESIFFSPPASYGDSPFRNYGRNANNYITLAEPLDLSDASQAFLTYRATWDIEPNFDYAQILGSIDGTVFTPLCGLYTKNGSPEQDPDQPLYDGFEDQWVEELVNLEDYLGFPEVYLRFRLVADRFSSGNGFNFDDLKVYKINDLSIVSNPQTKKKFAEINLYPNPVTEAFTLEIEPISRQLENTILKILDPYGKVISEQYLGNLDSRQVAQFQTNHWLPGMYFYQLTADQTLGLTGRFVVIH